MALKYTWPCSSPALKLPVLPQHPGLQPGFLECESPTSTCAEHFAAPYTYHTLGPKTDTGSPLSLNTAPPIHPVVLFLRDSYQVVRSQLDLTSPGKWASPLTISLQIHRHPTWFQIRGTTFPTLPCALAGADGRLEAMY